MAPGRSKRCRIIPGLAPPKISWEQAFKILSLSTPFMRRSVCASRQSAHCHHALCVCLHCGSTQLSPSAELAYGTDCYTS